MWFTLAALADTWEIPADFSSIEVAVSSGLIENGDTLNFAAGSHLGFDFNLAPFNVFQLTSSANAVLVPRALDTEVIKTGGGTVTISGLTLDGHTVARALYAVNADITVTNSTLRNGGNSTSGAGAFITGNGTFDQVDFIGNSASAHGGGLHHSDGVFSGTNLVFTGNAASQGGGGAYFGPTSSLSLSTVEFLANDAPQGAGLQIRGTAALQDMGFEDNVAMRGGGLYVHYGAEVDLSQALFDTNTATADGGGIYAADGVQTWDRVLFRGNTADRGGALWQRDDATITASNSAFCDNTGFSSSHALELFNGAPFIGENLIFLDNGLGQLPALSTIDGAGNLEIRHALFLNNSGTYAIDFMDSLTLEHTVFAGPEGGVQGAVAYGDIDANAFASGTSLPVGMPGTPITTEAQVVSRSCAVGAFPYATAPDLIDIGPDNDLDGSLADVGHLGGTSVNVDFFGADDDGDGSLVPVDCDDSDPTVQGERFWHFDGDGDTFGDLFGVATVSCTSPGGQWVLDNTDCDDSEPNANPGAPEQCDANDWNCNGQVDDGLSVDPYYLDDDGDGFGAGSATNACAPPSNDHVLSDTDCDDTDPTRFPDAPETCNGTDDDCDAMIDEDVTVQDWYLDDDGDGYGDGPPESACQSPSPHHVTNHDDCDDLDSARNPAATESCDGIDNDCDGDTDDDDTDVDAPEWFFDNDNDSYGDAGNPISSCIQPAHTVTQTGDCDDSNGNVYPTAPEACADGIDNDCDTLIDDDDPDFVNTGVDYGIDVDGDGYASISSIENACSGLQTPGFVALSNGEDCNDGNDAINPGVTEVCDGVDNDCFGGIDNGLPFSDYFIDGDGDGFGDPASLPVNSCQLQPGTSGNALDCDDANPAVHPNATETCDGIDEDCDNAIDNHLPTTTRYPDADGDFYGDASATPLVTCDTPAGTVEDHSDCNDNQSSIYPGAPEDPLDGIDSDCDGTPEEPPPPTLDSDGDGIPDAIDPDPFDASVGDEPDPTGPTYGCGCNQGAPTLLWLGPALLFLRRRR